MAAEESRPDRPHPGAAENRRRDAGGRRSARLISLLRPQLEPEPGRVTVAVVLRRDQRLLVRDLLPSGIKGTRDAFLAVAGNPLPTDRRAGDRGAVGRVHGDVPEGRSALQRIAVQPRVEGPAAGFSAHGVDVGRGYVLALQADGPAAGEAPGDPSPAAGEIAEAADEGAALVAHPPNGSRPGGSSSSPLTSCPVPSMSPGRGPGRRGGPGGSSQPNGSSGFGPLGGGAPGAARRRGGRVARPKVHAAAPPSAIRRRAMREANARTSAR